MGINSDTLNKVIQLYKANFQKISELNFHKWYAAEHYQYHWDLGEDDFVGMYAASYPPENRLIGSHDHSPHDILSALDDRENQIIRGLFATLFDETKLLEQRVNAFAMASDELLNRHGEGALRRYYQDHTTISVYLFFEYPEKYYLYDPMAFRNFAELVGWSGVPRSGNTERLMSFYKMCDEILPYIHADKALLALSKSMMDEDTYDDSAYHLLASDIVVFGGRLHEALRTAKDKKLLDSMPDLIITAESIELPPGEYDRSYWWLCSNPNICSLASMGVGEQMQLTLLTETGNRRKVFQNFLDAKTGDMVIGYESAPVKKVVALMEVARGSDGESVLFRKLEALPSPIDYAAIKGMAELGSMQFFAGEQGSLFRMTVDEFNSAMDLVRFDNPARPTGGRQPYTRKEFMDEVFMDDDEYETLSTLLLRKKNVILQGPPGVGKTFSARRLAWSLLGSKDESRIGFVQFHQSYSYEDFIMGYKPGDEGFSLKAGVFYRFCKQAENNPDQRHFFIIDEINRGNLSRIFGETLMLIEDTHRGEAMLLPYEGYSMAVPDNVYIIGMMNTADRSLAIMDYALRRRFSFYTMAPALESAGFKRYLNQFDNMSLIELMVAVNELNADIAADESLGEGFCIGQSYFTGQQQATDAWVRSIVEYDLIPILKEYWFDDRDRAEDWAARLRDCCHE